MTRARWRDPGAAPAGRVTAVETFFDVVFVFTFTQLTRTLEHDLSLAGIGRLLLLFGALWYMYGGYAWLTNHVPPRRASQKLVLFAAMAGFFIAAVGIPHAMHDDRFALAAFATIPIGALASAGLHLASVLGVVVVMLILSPRRTAAGAVVDHCEVVRIHR